MRVFLLLIALLLAGIGLVRAESVIERMGQPDKVGHYASGATITAVGSILLPGEYAPEYGLGLTVAAALGKEYYDHKHPATHKAEKADAAATILGGLLVYAAVKTDRWSVRRRGNINLITYTIK